MSWSYNGNIMSKLGFLYWVLCDGAVGIHDLAGTSEEFSFSGLYGISWGHIHGVSNYSTQEIWSEKTTVTARSRPVLCLWPPQSRKISYFGCLNWQVCSFLLLFVLFIAEGMWQFSVPRSTDEIEVATFFMRALILWEVKFWSYMQNWVLG
jgi:hypothetical protein